MCDRFNRRSLRSNRQSPRNCDDGPDRGFKEKRRRSERSKISQAMKDGEYEYIPVFKRHDKFDWF